MLFAFTSPTLLSLLAAAIHFAKAQILGGGCPPIAVLNSAALASAGQNSFFPSTGPTFGCQFGGLGGALLPQAGQFGQQNVYPLGGFPIGPSFLGGGGQILSLGNGNNGFGSVPGAGSNSANCCGTGNGGGGSSCCLPDGQNQQFGNLNMGSVGGGGSGIELMGGGGHQMFTGRRKR